jgi:hypothetical protein
MREPLTIPDYPLTDDHGFAKGDVLDSELFPLVS